MELYMELKKKDFVEVHKEEIPKSNYAGP